MLHGEQHLLFVVGVVDLLVRDDLFLVENFDGVEAMVVYAPDCCYASTTAGICVRKRTTIPR